MQIHGLYRLIYNSRTEIGKKFKKFVHNLLHKLRTKKILLLIEDVLNEKNRIIEEQKNQIEELRKDPKYNTNQIWSLSNEREVRMTRISPLFLINSNGLIIIWL